MCAVGFVQVAQLLYRTCILDTVGALPLANVCAPGVYDAVHMSEGRRGMAWCHTVFSPLYLYILCVH